MSFKPPALPVSTQTLSSLPLQRTATVQAVHDLRPNDRIAQRLRELGFVPGEAVRVLTHGPFGGEPLLVQIGYTRFALRQTEASRVTVEPA